MRTLLAALRHPIIQAPMAGVQNAELAIAACRAGIMGSLPAAMLTPEQLKPSWATSAQPSAKPFTTSTSSSTAPPLLRPNSTMPG